jgi:hypothetical protein
MIRAMPRKPTPKPDNPEQHKRFLDMARQVQVDESEGGFNRAFNKVIPRQAVPSPSAPGNQSRSKKAGEQ